MRSVSVLNLVCVAALLVGCASGPKFSKVTATIPDDKGLVYLYRESALYGVLSTWWFCLDEESLVTLASGEYYVFYVSEGKRTISGQQQTCIRFRRGGT